MKTYSKPIILLLLFLLKAQLLYSQWVQTNGPGNGTYVSSLLVSGANIFAGTDSGVYLSTDSAISWTQLNDGLTNIHVSSLAFIGSNIFAGTRDSGIFLSTNDGKKWIQVNNGFTDYLAYEVRSLAVSGYNIFACTEGGLLRSTNNGTSWTNLGFGLLPSNISALAISGNNIYVGNLDGVFRSTDNGTSWSLIYSTGAVVGVPFVAANENIVFAMAWGVIISTDNGLHWKSLSNIPQVYYMAFSGTNIFAATHPYDGGLFFSTNNGANWTQINDGLPGNLFIYSLIVIGNDVLAGTGAGVWHRPLSELVGVSKEINVLPMDYTLYQNYPNPFNPTTTISYQLKEKGFVKLNVYDITGKLIKVLVNQTQDPGSHETEFNAKGLASGIYFYRLEIFGKGSSPVFSNIKKLVLLK